MPTSPKIIFLSLAADEEQILQKGVETIISESGSFAFLHDEEDLYDEREFSI